MVDTLINLRNVSPYQWSARRDRSRSRSRSRRRSTYIHTCIHVEVEVEVKFKGSSLGLDLDFRFKSTYVCSMYIDSVDSVSMIIYVLGSSSTSTRS